MEELCCCRSISTCLSLQREAEDARSTHTAQLCLEPCRWMPPELADEVCKRSSFIVQHTSEWLPEELNAPPFCTNAMSLVLMLRRTVCRRAFLVAGAQLLTGLCCGLDAQSAADALCSHTFAPLLSVCRGTQKRNEYIRR